MNGIGDYAVHQFILFEGWMLFCALVVCPFVAWVIHKL